jgi:transcription termination factor NusB
VVSDAVELAKEFGTAESGAFVNAVLDKVMNAQGAAPAAEAG